MNFSNERILAHNDWPTDIRFKAEDAFRNRLLGRDSRAPFEPMQLTFSDDPDYQRCIGHLLDALDQIPSRPDYAFDHFFRIIDIVGTSIPIGKGIRGVVQGVAQSLLVDDRASWEQIIDALCTAMPLRTHEFLAKRLLSASLLPPGKEGLHKRALHTLGSNFYPALITKYTTDKSGYLITDESKFDWASAGKLLKLYLSGKPGTRTKAASTQALDLTKPSNVPDHRRRSEVLTSLLLFQVRNERAHGAVISPFRTSKATIVRYQSYYFSMLISYIYALGIMNLKFKCIAPPELLAGCLKNIQAQRDFFDL
jgi:hypothetical protein